MQKNLVQRVTQLKIANASKPHQKLVPIYIREFLYVYRE
jgi:hypothetical protein